LLVLDISTSGLLVQSNEPLQVGEQIQLELARGGTRQIEVVWTNGSYYGCRFLKPISSAAVSAAQLMSAPQLATPADRHDGHMASDFGNRLTELRTAKNSTIDAIAEQLGVSRQAMWYWETGRRTPRPEHVKKIAQLFGVPAAQLLPAQPRKVEPGHHTAMGLLKREIARLHGVSEEKITVIVEF
jgi:transcriptional regulator with XRE-family HTH domain